MDLTPDTILNTRYKILRKLGQGGMGAVYLAHDLSLDHDVAVKVNRSSADEATSQFLREARLLAALRHPNLPRVIDYFLMDISQCLVMDYIPGQDLDSALQEHGRFSIDQVITWARQLGGALTYMHRQSPPVIHRDIKPGNIRLTADGEAVLVDFGIARVIGPGQVTTAGAYGYTPGYAPPEQYTNTGATTPLSDQYSLAATLYTLLTGQKPADAVQRVLGQAELTPVTVLAPEVPLGTALAVQRGLSIKPTERFSAMDEFIAALSGPPAPRAAQQPAAVVAAQKAPKMPIGAFWIGLVVLCFVGVGLFLLLRTLNSRAAISATPTLPAAAMTSETAQPASGLLQPASTLASPSLTSTTAVTEPIPTATATQSPPTPTLVPLGRGGLVVFASDRADGKTLQLWTMRLALKDDGMVQVSDLKQLTDTPGDKTHPVWSPDGTELLYVAPGAIAGNGMDVWKMRLDAAQPPLDLTNQKGDESEPAWSPDGMLVAYTNDGRADGVLQLYLVNPDGTSPLRLSFDQYEFGAAWSPDMKKLAFIMDVAGNDILYLRAPTDLAALGAGSYAVTPQPFDLTNLKGSLGQVARPAWSPDGNWVAYSRQDAARWRIFLARVPMQLPERDLIQLSAGPHDTAPAWSPDSQWVLYSSDRDGNQDVYIVRATGQGAINLTSAPGRDLDPDWQRNP